APLGSLAWRRARSGTPPCRRTVCVSTSPRATPRRRAIASRRSPPAPPRAGRHRLALLLHGFPECWFSWREQLPLLARLGWRAWAPDLRGYGESERPPRVADYAIERLLDD